MALWPTILLMTCMTARLPRLPRHTNDLEINYCISTYVSITIYVTSNITGLPRA